MAIMTATRTLRDGPFGKSLNIKATAGAKVRIIDDTTHPLWTKIELLEGNADPKPQGWVSSASINLTSDTLGPLDKTLFATECIFNSVTFRVMPHYLMAIAHMRTNITDGPNANGVDYGPFALSQTEWTHFGSLEEFALNMSAADFKSWLAQCTVFAAMTNVTQRKFALLLANQPTAAQLALAQMIGTSAALRAIHAPQKKISEILDSVPQPELEADIIEKARLPDRYKEFLDDKTGEQALNAVTQKLQTSLDETKSFITRAAGEYIKFATDFLQKTSSSNFIKAEIFGKKAIRYIAADGSTLTCTNGSISWRQNNPGNIINSSIAKKNGAIAEGARFAIFPSESVGFDAILALLSGSSYRNLSLNAAINKYAPASDGNKPAQYVAFITNTTGISPTRS